MKQICSIVLITLALLSLIEISSWVYRRTIGREHTGLFWVRGAGHAIPGPCDRYIFDLQLGYIQDETTGCTVRNAEIIPGYVHYFFPEGSKTKTVRVVTLGGSTTNGFFQFTNGYTWPFWFNQICNDRSKNTACDVYNGAGVGSSSSGELKKLFRDVLVLNPPANIIISFNGSNDVTNHDGPLTLKYPYYDSDQLTVLNEQKFPATWDNIEIFPNTVRMLKKILTVMGYSPYKNSKMFELPPPGPAYLKAKFFREKAREMNIKMDTDTITRLMEFQPVSKKYAAALPEADAFNNVGDLWKRNVVLMHGIAKLTGAEYLVFLQPAMGLAGQDPALMGDNDKKLFKTLDPSYLDDLNTSYDLIRKECKALDYCIDISDILAGQRKDLYHDPRHANAQGNKIIAERIFEEIKKRDLIPH